MFKKLDPMTVLTIKACALQIVIGVTAVVVTKKLAASQTEICN